MTHPADRELALYAGGDDRWFKHLLLGQHIARCADCGKRVAAFRRDRAALLSSASELPAGLDWDRLAAEMTANIRVGLEAGECVGDVRERPSPKVRFGWHPVLVGTGLAAVLLGGFYLNFPVEQRASLAARVSRLWSAPPPASEDGVALEATRAGIQLSQDGSAVTFMNSGKEQPIVVVSARGGLRSSYVDEDTGQVTITNVYAQ